MKFCKRLSLVLCVCVLCSVFFSVPVSAEESLPFDTVSITTELYYGSTETLAYSDKWLNGTVEKSVEYHFSCTDAPGIKHQIALYNADGSIIYKKGDEHKISISGISIIGEYGSGTNWQSVLTENTFQHMQYRLQYTNGSYSEYRSIPDEDLSISDVIDGSCSIGVTTKILIDKDVKRVFFIHSAPLNISDTSQKEIYYRTTNTTFSASSEKVDEKVGLLNGIIEWIKSIIQKIGDVFSLIGQFMSSVNQWFSNLKDSIGSWFSNLAQSISGLFSNLFEWLSNMWETIKSLPSQVWQLINNGLQYLFIPNPENMQNLKVEFAELWYEKLGAVQQAIEAGHDLAEMIKDADATDTITMPVVSLRDSGIPFSFGGYTVKVVPDKFGVLVTALKWIISALCTTAFVNALSNRYYEVMGVQQ